MPVTTTGSESLAPLELEKQLHGIEHDEEESVGMPPPRIVSKWLLLIVAVGMLVSGTFDSIATKFCNLRLVPKEDGGEPVNFKGPFWQTWTMYLGELLVLIAFFTDKYIAKRRGKQQVFDLPTSAKSFQKPHCPIWLWIVPMLFDFIATTMNNYATLFCQASVAQMLRNFNVVITAGLTMLYLRKALRIHQFVGVVVITIGMVLVGLYSILNPDDSNEVYDNGKYAAIGVAMAIGGTTLSAFQFVYEEKLLRKYYCSPFEAVGWMGLYGTIVGAIILVIAEFTGIEDVRGILYQFAYGSKDANLLLLFNCLYVISISIYNGCGLSVTKLASGLLRTILQAGRTVCVWIVSLIIKYDTFQALQFSGLLVILIAIFLYNYNYFVPTDSWSGDRVCRKPLVCCCLVSPDAPAESLVTPDDLERLKRQRSEKSADEKSFDQTTSGSPIAHEEAKQES